MSLHFKTCRIRKTPIADIGWQHPLPAKDTLQRRHDPCDIQPPGLHRKVSLSCTKAEGQPHKISRCIRSKQQAPDSGDSCQAGQRRTKSYWTGQDKTPAERRSAMTWAQRLKRVFNIDVEICTHCGGPAKVIACVEDQQIIDKILSHLKKKDRLPSLPNVLPETRAPPSASLFY